MNKKLVGLYLFLIGTVCGITAMQDPVVLASTTMQKPMVLASKTMNDHELTKIIYNGSGTNYFTHIPDDLKNMIFCFTQAGLVKDSLHDYTPYALLNHPNPFVSHQKMLYRWAKKYSHAYSPFLLRFNATESLYGKIQIEGNAELLRKLKDAFLLFVAKNNQSVSPLLVLGADPNADIACDKPLHKAIWPNRLSDPHIGNVIDLLSHGADVNAVTRDGYTPLFLAVRKSSMQAVQTLLSYNPNIDQPVGKNKNGQVSEDTGWTPIFEAIKKKNVPIIQLLLNHGANPNQRIEGYPLLAHAMASEIDILPLLRAGADPNGVSDESISHLEIAIDLVNSHYVQQLLNAGADPSKNRFNENIVDLARNVQSSYEQLRKDDDENGEVITQKFQDIIHILQKHTGSQSECNDPDAATVNAKRNAEVAELDEHDAKRHASSDDEK